MTDGPAAVDPAAAAASRSAVTYCGVPTAVQVGESIDGGASAVDPVKLAGKYAVAPTSSDTQQRSRALVVYRYDHCTASSRSRVVT